MLPNSLISMGEIASDFPKQPDIPSKWFSPQGYWKIEISLKFKP